MTANSSVYFLRFPFADESEILSGFSFMNESSKKYVIILIILDKLRLNKIAARWLAKAVAQFYFY